MQWHSDDSMVKLGHCVIEAEIASGVKRGKYVLIPCITLIPSDTQFPVYT